MVTFSFPNAGEAMRPAPTPETDANAAPCSARWMKPRRDNSVIRNLCSDSGRRHRRPGREIGILHVGAEISQNLRQIVAHRRLLLKEADARASQRIIEC